MAIAEPGRARNNLKEVARHRKAHIAINPRCHQILTKVTRVHWNQLHIQTLKLVRIETPIAFDNRLTNRRREPFLQLSSYLYAQQIWMVELFVQTHRVGPLRLARAADHLNKEPIHLNGDIDPAFNFFFAYSIT